MLSRPPGRDTGISPAVGGIVFQVKECIFFRRPVTPTGENSLLPPKLFEKMTKRAFFSNFKIKNYVAFSDNLCLFYQCRRVRGG